MFTYGSMQKATGPKQKGISRAKLVAGIAAGLVGTAAVVGVTLSQRHNPGSKLQIIPVMSPMALGQYKTWVPYNEPATSGMYEYQATADPMNAMGTNTAFLGSHDGAHVGWQTARRQNGLQLQMAPYSSLAHYDTWVPNDDAASSFYPVAHTHVEGAGMGTNSAFIGSSDGAHTGWSTARAPLKMDKSLAKLKNALNQQLHYVSTGAGNAQASAIFDDLNDGPHGANNHHLHKVAKHTPKDKSAKQSLHYVSGQAGAAGVSAIFDGIADSKHGANNHGLHEIAKHTPKDKSTKQSLKMKQSLMITDVSDSLSAMKEKKLEEIEAAHHERMSKILEEHQEKIAQIEEDHLPLYYLNKLTDGEKAPKQSLRYVSSEAGAAGVRAIFDGIADSEHGSNNGGLHKHAKHTPKDP